MAPAATPADIDLLARLMRTTRQLSTGLESATAAAGLSFIEWRTLNRLVEAGGSLPLKDLPCHLMCVKSNLTVLIDRLERDGAVRRLDHPTDRRATVVAVTEAGIARHAAGRKAVDACARAAFGGFAEADRCTLERLLQSIRFAPAPERAGTDLRG